MTDRYGGVPWLATFLVTIWLSSLLAGSSSSSRLVPVTPATNDSASRAVEVRVAQQRHEDAEEEAKNSTAMCCDDARLKCAYRTGCGQALETYHRLCASVIHGDVNDCLEVCQYALIALTSTDEGKELMTCDCAKDDVMCRQSKQRAEICRSSVTATMNRTRVSCRVAAWICNADALCSTALRYYNENCKRMFHGRKCTKRCLNSINILRRQEKAAKLNTCFCEGAEDYDCNAIHRNMDELCFNKPTQHHKYQGREHNPGAPSDSSSRPGSTASGGSGYARTNKVPTSASQAVICNWRTLLLGCFALLLHRRLSAIAAPTGTAVSPKE